MLPTLQSQLREKQLQYIEEQLEQYTKDMDESEKELFYQIVLGSFENQIGNPLYQPEKIMPFSLPIREEWEEEGLALETDLSILFYELGVISRFCRDVFNYAQTEKERIKKSVESLHGTVSDLQMIVQNESQQHIFYKESFNDISVLDKSFASSSVLCDMHTKQGVLTLKRKANKNLVTSKCKVEIEGNGQAGTDHLVRRVHTDKEFDNFEYIGEKTENKNPLHSIDGNPSTVFEYQNVNVLDSFRSTFKNFDFEWAKSKEYGDTLRVKLKIKLEKEEEINWINLSPFFSEGNKTFHIHSIRTSIDAFEYEGLFEKERYTIDAAINEFPQTFKLEDIFIGSESYEESKLSSQGVWSFESRKARYIEIVLEQPTSHKELIGQEVYWRRQSNAEWIQIRKQEATDDIIEGKYGIYKIGKDEEIKKELVVTEGWRYAIGIRDIGINAFEYEKKSEFVSKLFKVEKGVKRVSLFSNEVLPPSYKDVVKERNEYIQYFVSFNDVDWYRVSPQHHQATIEEFPPKLLIINHEETNFTDEIKLHRQNIQLKEYPTQIRLRIVLKRKDDDAFKMTTPIVEDVAIKIELEKEGVQ